jgi:type IV pilus assembly protein PilC
MLLKLADFYDEEVDAAVDSVVGMMEPIIIVFLGGAVGGLLIAMYMPMFSMGENIKG